jgi:hypothetical protein
MGVYQILVFYPNSRRFVRDAESSGACLLEARSRDASLQFVKKSKTLPRVEVSDL